MTFLSSGLDKKAQEIVEKMGANESLFGLTLTSTLFILGAMYKFTGN